MNSPLPDRLPLYVDLDGTLFPGDTLWDSTAILVKQSPLVAVQLPSHIARGPLHLKNWLAGQVCPDANVLPYSKEVVALCKAEKAAGRRVVLATAAHRRIADAVAEHLGCFDAIIATDATINRKGAAKLAAIQADAQGPFIYAGDTAADLPIWRVAAGAICVGKAANYAPEWVGCPVLLRIGGGTGRLRPLIKALRPHQWVKNLLVFVPMLAGHQTGSSTAWIASTLAFFAFCACASSVYLLNDLLDLENDRGHARKRHRPFASGALPFPLGMALAPGLLVLSAVVALLVSPGTLAILALYYAITLAYSFSLKGVALLDVFLLAGLYTIRVIAGSVALSVPPSPWLLAFMVFLFLSLALGKRAAELHGLAAKGSTGAKGRGWMTADLPFVTTTGIAAAFAAALVVGLYVASTTASGLYRYPLVLWGLVPLILWWSCRVWLKAQRGMLHEDPIVFALRDPGSWAMGVIALILLLGAGPLGGQLPSSAIPVGVAP